MRIVRVSDIESEVSYPAVSEAVPAPETPNESNASAGKPQRQFGGYAMLVAAGILLSRVAGLVRTVVFARYFGASSAADAFNIALKVPNFLQNMLGEGVLSASFIPVYSRLIAKGEDRLAGRVAGVFASFLVLGVTLLVLIGVLAAPLILQITAAGLPPDVMELAVRLTRIIFPGVGLLVLYAWALGILNTHRQFFIGYVAPVLWSAAMIATMVIFGMTMRGAPLATALAWGTLIGCALQFGIEIPFVLRHAKHLSFGFDRTLEPVRTIFRNILPVVGGRGVVQISGYVDTFLATFIARGAVSSLMYAQTIYMLPISVFGMAVANAELPQMSGVTGTDDEIKTSLRKRLDRSIRQVAFFVIPSAVAFVLIGRLLITAMYERGEFTRDATHLVWYILIGSSIGLLPATLGRLYSSTFYALHDTRTPFRIALARVFGGAALALTFAFPLRPMFAAIIGGIGLPMPHTAGGAASLGVVGISSASAFAAWIEFTLLRGGIRKRIGAGAPKTGFMLKLWTAALLAGLAALVIDYLDLRLPLQKFAEALIACGVFGAVYFGVAFAFGVPEVRATLGRFIKR